MMGIVRFALVGAFLIAGLARGAQPAKPKAPPPDPVAKLDDWKKWPARDFANATVLPGAVCVYIKDPGPKTNREAGILEGKDFLGSEEVRVKLRGFTRTKIKSDGSDGKGWPAEWLNAADNGAVLVLFSGDKTKVFSFGKGTPKKDYTKEALLQAADVLLKYEADRKAAAEAKAKEEAARNPPPAEEKPALPGLDNTKKPAAEKKPKPKDAGPETE